MDDFNYTITETHYDYGYCRDLDRTIVFKNHYNSDGICIQAEFVTFVQGDIKLNAKWLDANYPLD